MMPTMQVELTNDELVALMYLTDGVSRTPAYSEWFAEMIGGLRNKLHEARLGALMGAGSNN